eukprot:scaffold85659_cov30-Tisochrysis_lutea.AAC.1
MAKALFAHTLHTYTADVAYSATGEPAAVAVAVVPVALLASAHSAQHVRTPYCLESTVCTQSLLSGDQRRQGALNVLLVTTHTAHNADNARTMTIGCGRGRGTCGPPVGCHAHSFTQRSHQSKRMTATS